MNTSVVVTGFNSTNVNIKDLITVDINLNNKIYLNEYFIVFYEAHRLNVV